MRSQAVYAETEAGLSRAELRAALQRSLGDCAGLRKVLLLPPDFTRFHSAAGTLTQLLCELLPADCQVDVMPALGTHTPVTRAQWERMFAGIPYEKMIVHNWRTDTKKLGCVPAEVVARLSEGTMAEPIDVELNARVMDPSYDLVLSIGQVVPHEVAGMANRNKNLFVGCGGIEMINRSHMLGALYGLERIMGRDHTPVRELYDYAVHVLDLQEQLMRAWAQDERTIRLGASTIPSSCILPEVLPAFRAQHPEAVFSILQSDSDGVLQQLRAGRFALGFTGAKAEAQDVVFSPFFTDRMVLITPNTPRYQRLLKEKMPVPALLAQEPLLLRETGSGSQKCADAFLEEAGLDLSTLRVAARLNDQQSIRNLVAAGLGISIISGKAAQDDCERGKLLSFPLPEKSAGRSLYLVWRKAGALHPQTLAFIEFVRNFYENT